MSDEPIDISIDPDALSEGRMATVPVVRRDWVDDAVDAPTWDPGAYEGHDLMIKASNVTPTMMSIRRQWTITTTMGQMDAGR